MNGNGIRDEVETAPFTTFLMPRPDVGADTISFGGFSPEGSAPLAVVYPRTIGSSDTVIVCLWRPLPQGPPDIARVSVSLLDHSGRSMKLEPIDTAHDGDVGSSVWWRVPQQLDPAGMVLRLQMRRGTLHAPLEARR